MIDLPNGASGLIAGNTFVQGKDKENWSGFIVVAAEAHDFPADGLVVRDNDARLAPRVERSPAFVADLSGDRIPVVDNRLGQGVRRFERRCSSCRIYSGIQFSSSVAAFGAMDPEQVRGDRLDYLVSGRVLPGPASS